MRLYVVTCSNSRAYGHYKKTVQSPVPFSTLSSYLSKSKISELKKNVSKSTKALSMWGFSSPVQQIRLWKKMRYGDVVYFYRNKEHFLSARIVYTVNNVALAKKDWGLDDDGRPYRYIFFIDDLSPISVNQKKFNKLTGKSGDFYLGGRIYESPKSTMILKGLNNKKYQGHLRKSVKKKKGKPKKIKTQVTNYKRDDDVIEYVKTEAKGYCDLCHKRGPFKKKGEYFLECHHVKRLADGGDDDVSNAVALCPNCHRKMHSLNLKKDTNKLKKRIRSRDKNL